MIKTIWRRVYFDVLWNNIINLSALSLQLYFTSRAFEIFQYLYKNKTRQYKKGIYWQLFNYYKWCRKRNRNRDDILQHFVILLSTFINFESWGTERWKVHSKSMRSVRPNLPKKFLTFALIPYLVNLTLLIGLLYL